MCIILAISKPELISEKILNNCATVNCDSVGLSYVAKGEIITLKSIDVNKGIKFFEEAKKYRDDGTGILMHYRIATSGKIDIANCHPYLFNNKTMVFAHNGILSGLGNKKECDTKELIGILNTINFDVNNPKHILLLQVIAGYNNKFAILDKAGKLTLINSRAGIFEAGNWFSNHSYKTYEPTRAIVSGYNPNYFNYKGKHLVKTNISNSRKVGAFCRCGKLLLGYEQPYGLCVDCQNEKKHINYNTWD